MIQAENFLLRTLTEADLPEFQRFMADLTYRGEYYPHFIQTETQIPPPVR